MHTGGRVTATGLAYLEAGEQVVPKARVDRSEQMDGGGGGDTVVTIEEGAIQISDSTNPGETADKVLDAFERKLRRQYPNL
jgi:hypothetical protein